VTLQNEAPIPGEHDRSPPHLFGAVGFISGLGLSYWQS